MRRFWEASRGRLVLTLCPGLSIGVLLALTVLAGRTTTWEQVHTIRLPRPPDRLRIATGATSGYFPGLSNLVGSIRFWCPNCTVAFYDLGLTEEELATVHRWCGVSIRDGANYTSHGALKQYAWKPLAIRDAVDAFGSVLWLDAGSTVTGRLEPIFEALHRDGHFLVQGQDMDCSRWTHPGMFDYFHANRSDFVDKPSFSGNTVGFAKDTPGYRQVLLPLVDCALHSACISPEGSSLQNHRYDQSAMSVLAYSAIMEGRLEVEPQTWVLAATRDQLSPCHVPSQRLVWTSRYAGAVEVSPATY